MVVEVVRVVKVLWVVGVVEVVRMVEVIRVVEVVRVAKLVEVIRVVRLVMVVMVVEVIRLVEVVMVVRSQCWSPSIIINHNGFLVWGPKGPNNNKKNFTLCMTMPQAAGKNSKENIM